MKLTELVEKLIRCCSTLANSDTIVIRLAREVVDVAATHICHQINLRAAVNVNVVVRGIFIIAQSLLPEVKGTFLIATASASRVLVGVSIVGCNAPVVL